MSEPMYLSVYGEWSKQYGYARLRRGGDPQRLIWLDKNVSRLAKAEEAELYAYVVQNFDDSPDYFVAGADLSDGRQVSETNPFHNDYAWGHSELIEYENTWGRKLQGALYYPADYEPGRQYPMIVYIYEIRSPSVHTYNVPSNRSAYNTAVFTSQGYFVLQPDIVYRDRNPGLSAVEALEPAVQTVLATGMVDPERVGLTGHSWGGYQTAFTVTQTDIFSAAVAGAPLTNLVSMYLSVYWNSGSTDARIFEISQGRMEVPFWEDLESYVANSPVFHVENMNTPLLVAHGDEDGAVDFNQGVEYYNAARRAGKDFVLLVYEGENHGNRQKANQIDYHNRIVEWFGHYLKGEPAPEWITEGVSYLDQEEARKKKDESEPPNPGAR
jgi:dipeptidyl aminopeptidase/acylaminoacyl peptidase